MNTKWVKFSAFFLALLSIGILLIILFQNSDPEIPSPPTQDPTNEVALPEETPEEINQFSGLIYKTQEGLYQIGNDGSEINLANCSADLLSADLKSMFLVEAGEIWQLSLDSCESKNISNSLALWENNPQIWPTDAGKIFVGINPEMSSGAPAILDLKTSELVYLDGIEGWTNSGVAPSADGSQIALRSNMGAAIYDVSNGILESINLAEFNLEESDFTRLEGPAWSPDGNTLAWVVGYQGQIGHLLLDLQNNSSSLLHLYTAIGRGGWPLPPVWSPDGNWLVVDVWAEDSHQAGLYLLSVDGSEEYYLGTNLIDPLWSPDSQTLIYTSFNGSSSTYFLNIADRLSVPLPIPESGVPVAWPAP